MEVLFSHYSFLPATNLPCCSSHSLIHPSALCMPRSLPFLSCLFSPDSTCESPQPGLRSVCFCLTVSYSSRLGNRPSSVICRRHSPFTVCPPVSCALPTRSLNQTAAASHPHRLLASHISEDTRQAIGLASRQAGRQASEHAAAAVGAGLGLGLDQNSNPPASDDGANRRSGQRRSTRYAQYIVVESLPLFCQSSVVEPADWVRSMSCADCRRRRSAIVIIMPPAIHQIDSPACLPLARRRFLLLVFSLLASLALCSVLLFPGPTLSCSSLFSAMERLNERQNKN
ncbi:uncharacterized protein J3D65DRAFT_122655 [Phyllosticta citribraziliensis]|uniref:Transmembrane protein n=1 Tax=Phyllosticta citribraziliensis TaxID=989973 RepID=A0ABR1L8X8_9PEZI